MPSQVITIRLCDACFIQLDKETIAAATYTIGIAVGENRTTPHIVEACELHRKPIEELLALIEQTVVLTPATAAKPARVEGAPLVGQSVRMECPICHATKSRGIMASHIWTQHLGANRRPPQPVTCPDCGLVNPDGAGMGQHRYKAHRYNGIDEAVAIYHHRLDNPPTDVPADELDEGDPELFDDQADAPEPAPAPVKRSHRRKVPAAS